MAKSNSVRTNMRLRDEARFALEELAERMGCSQTAVVERLVIAAHTNATLEPPVSQSYHSVAGVPVRIDPASVPGVTQGIPPPKKPVIIKRYKCDHCGTSPAVPRVGG